MIKFNDKMKAVLVYSIVNILAIGFGITIALLAEKPKEVITETIIEKEPVVNRGAIYEIKEFNNENFFNYLVEVNVKFPKIVMAQAILESGNFESRLFKEHNNPFGMMIAKQRPTLSLKGNVGFASYKNWQSAVLDYALFQSRYMKAYDTEEKYLTRLGEVYAEDPGYVSKVKEIAKTIN